MVEGSNQNRKVIILYAATCKKYIYNSFNNEWLLKLKRKWKR